MKSLQYCDRQEIWQAMRNSIDVNTMGRFKYEYNCIASIDNVNLRAETQTNSSRHRAQPAYG